MAPVFKSNLLFVVGHSMHASCVSRAFSNPSEYAPSAGERDSIANTVSRYQNINTDFPNARTSLRSPRGNSSTAHTRVIASDDAPPVARAIIPLPRLARPATPRRVSTEAPRIRAAPIVSVVVIVVVVVVVVADRARVTAPRARVAVATGITIVLVAIAIAIVRLVLHRVAVCPPVPRASVARRRHGAEDFDSSQNPPRRGTHAPITTHHES